MRDLRYSLRALMKSPGFTCVVVLSLAIGIGASSAVFSAVNSLLLHPYTFPSLDQIVLIKENAPGGGPADKPVTPADFLDLRAGTRPFKAIAAFRFRNFNMTGAGEPDAVLGFQVSPGFSDLLGVAPLMGRAFDPEQELEGEDRSAILMYGFWQGRFGGDPDVLGRTINLNGNSFTVTGIMPEGFNYPLGGDLWVPLALTAQEKTERKVQSLYVLGRLADGVSMTQGLTGAQSLAKRLEEQYPTTNAGRTMSLQRLREEQYGYTAPLFLTLQGAALFVLLLAVANVTNLLLARVIGRRREIAIRRALGSSGRGVIQLFLSETVLLSCLAGAAAVFLAYWGANLIRVAIPEDMSKWIAGWNDIRVDGRVLGFTLLLACTVAVLSGLAAAFQNSRFDLNKDLKETSLTAGSSQGRRRLRSSLVVAEIVLSMALLVGAGLMIKGFFRLVAVFQGFQPDNVLVLTVSLPENRYKGDAEVRTFFDRALSGIAALPGVESVAIARNIPASNVDNKTTSLTIEGRAPLAASEYPAADSQIISESFFSALRIRMLEGRGFTRFDGGQAPPVAVISQSMADRFWPGEHPVGSRIKLSTPEADSPWVTIVGICSDIKQNWWDAVSRPTFYLPYTQAPTRTTYVLTRTARDPLHIVAPLRTAFQAIDPDQPIEEIHTLEKEISDAVAPLRIIGILMTVFGALALVLSAVGVFSILAYTVAERTHEFGLRIALGARPTDVLRTVHAQTLKLAVTGLAIALPIPIALGAIVSSLFSGVITLDIGTFAGLAVGLVLVSLIAGYVPARRAARVDPMIALRNE